MIGSLLDLRPNQPVSTAMVVASAVVSPALLLLNAAADLFHSLEPIKLLLLSAAIGFPILFLCFALISSALSTAVEIQRLRRRLGRDVPTDDELQAAVEDEWPSAWAAGWLCSFILNSIAAVAYYKQVRLGATLILVASILTGLVCTAIVEGHRQVARYRKRVELHEAKRRRL